MDVAVIMGDYFCAAALLQILYSPKMDEVCGVSHGVEGGGGLMVDLRMGGGAGGEGCECE